MLRIDRVRTDMELLPAPSTRDEAAQLDRREIRQMVLDVLRDELRELERRGAL
jgi:hypothetical protein